MKKYIPMRKLSKRARNEINSRDRNVWNINPVTRIVPNKKAYNRRKYKNENIDY